MPNTTNQLQWLNTRYAAIINELQGTETSETNEKLVELLTLNQQIQTQMMLTILANQQHQQKDIDDQLTEISQYLQEIVTDHILEAENLEKIR